MHLLLPSFLPHIFYAKLFLDKEEKAELDEKGSADLNPESVNSQADYKREENQLKKDKDFSQLEVDYQENDFKSLNSDTNANGKLEIQTVINKEQKCDKLKPLENKNLSDLNTNSDKVIEKVLDSNNNKGTTAVYVSTNIAFSASDKNLDSGNSNVAEDAFVADKPVENAFNCVDNTINSVEDALFSVRDTVHVTEDVPSTADDTLNTTEDISNTADDTLQTTEDVPSTADDTVNTTEDVPNTADDTLQTTEDVPNTPDDTVHITEDVPNTADDTLQTTEDVSNTPDDTVHITEDVPNTADDILQTTEDVPNTADDPLQTTENVPNTPDNTVHVTEDVPNTADDTLQTTEDVPNTADNTLNTIEGIPNTADNPLQTTEDVPNTADDPLQTTENVPNTADGPLQTTEDVPNIPDDTVNTIEGIPSTADDTLNTTECVSSAAIDTLNTVKDFQSIADDVPSTANHTLNTPEDFGHDYVDNKLNTIEDAPSTADDTNTADVFRFSNDKNNREKDAPCTVDNILNIPDEFRSTASDTIKTAVEVPSTAKSISNSANDSVYTAKEVPSSDDKKLNASENILQTSADNAANVADCAVNSIYEEQGGFEEINHTENRDIFIKHTSDIADSNLINTTDDASDDTDIENRSKKNTFTPSSDSKTKKVNAGERNEMLPNDISKAGALSVVGDVSTIDGDDTLKSLNCFVSNESSKEVCQDESDESGESNSTKDLEKIHNVSKCSTKSIDLNEKVDDPDIKSSCDQLETNDVCLNTSDTNQHGPCEDQECQKTEATAFETVLKQDSLKEASSGDESTASTSKTENQILSEEIPDETRTVPISSDIQIVIEETKENKKDAPDDSVKRKSLWSPEKTFTNSEIAKNFNEMVKRRSISGSPSRLPPIPSPVKLRQRRAGSFTDLSYTSKPFKRISCVPRESVATLKEFFEAKTSETSPVHEQSTAD